ncbi:polysaccharide deacetylase family protein [Actinocorallia longicatena]|uniref:Polysaccharide deacetylase family protein n=1 Tax=Actinocorallia longicatena TaxID=111803 RepID=A0ABP6QJA0_9ACTN
MPTLHKFAVLVVGAALLFGLLLMPEDPHGGKEAGAVVSPGTGTPGPSASAPPTKGPPPKPQPASAEATAAKADELGQVPVLMYHRIVAKKAADLDRTPKELRTELEALATAGYVPVTAAEYVQGKIDIPLGKHPVVLTFDDGYPDHIALDAQGAPAPDTAAGVIMDVASRHPEFRPVATFYVIKDPFQLGATGPDPTLTWLVDHGFEVANHTSTHPDLSRLSEKKVQKEIGDQEKLVQKLTGRPSITFAYPYGAVPKKHQWAMKGDGWAFQGAFLAGYDPAPSPFDKRLDRAKIPRIRSMGKVKKDGCDQFCSTAWLAWLDKNPGKRYTSDGDPSVITVPEAEVKDLAPGLAEKARIY